MSFHTLGQYPQSKERSSRRVKYQGPGIISARLPRSTSLPNVIMVTVITSDGEKFTLEQDVASQCGLIADFAGGGGEGRTIEHRCISSYDWSVLGDQSEEIPIPNVSSKIMRKVCAFYWILSFVVRLDFEQVSSYCEHHRNDPPGPQVPEGTATGSVRRRTSVGDEWDKEYISTLR